MARVFVSHAKADEKLIDAFVDLLHTGLNLRQDDIFCTSLEGTGIPRGSNFVNFIKDQLQSSDFVIMIITEAYYESVFCLCELGATWITGSDAMPLLVPPLDYDDLKAVLAGVQVGNIHDKWALNELRDRLINAEIASGTTSKWESKRDTFILHFPEIAKELKRRSSVTAEEHARLVAAYEEAQRTIVDNSKKQAELEGTIDQLRKCKDAADVTRVMSNRTSAIEQFEDLKTVLWEELRHLPNKVVEALYYDTREDEWYPPDGWGTRDDWQEIDDAKERGFIDVVDRKVAICDSNPRIKRAKSAIGGLREFMNNAPPDFVSQFETDHDYQFDICNRTFWDEHVDR